MAEDLFKILAIVVHFLIEYFLTIYTIDEVFIMIFTVIETIIITVYSALRNVYN